MVFDFIRWWSLVDEVPREKDLDPWRVHDATARVVPCDEVERKLEHSATVEVEYAVRGQDQGAILNFLVGPESNTRDE